MTTVSTPTPTRNRALALALFAAPWGFLVTNATYAWASRNGLNDLTNADALKLAAAYPQLLRVGLVAGMISCLLVVPAIVGAMRLIGDRARRLAFVGGGLAAAGYICYFGVLISNYTILAMAERGGPVADYVAVLDASQADASSTWVFLLFVLGNLVGTFLLGLALLRSRTVPWWAAAAIMAWPPLHVVGLVVGNELFEITGAILQGIGFAVVGVRLLRAGRSTVDVREPVAPTGALVAG
jgi:hypothetical protein